MVKIVLNHAQKNFRKEMKDLQQEGYLKTENMYKYRHRIPRRNRPWWSFSIIGIILFVLAFSSVPIKLYNEYIVHRDKQMNTYLFKKSSYDIQSSNLVNDLILHLPTDQHSVFLIRVKDASSTIETLYNQSLDLKAPKDFQHHKETFIPLMDQRRLIIRILLVSAESKSFDQKNLNALINELTTLSSSERLALMDAFRSADIEYQLLSNGTIKYWYKSNDPGLEKDRKEQILKTGNN